ncbi:MAG: hypothetical protein ACE14S_03880 [Candidatus Bathyarchaeia archaeon]
MPEDLGNLEKAVLIALFEEVGLSTHAHVPILSIQRHFPKNIRGFCIDALKALVKKGYIVKHPTSGSMTYSLTAYGVAIIRQILK